MKNKVFKYQSSLSEWQDFIKAVYSKQTIEIDSQMFDYWLVVLPPVYMHKTRVIDTLNNGNKKDVFCDFGYAEEQGCIVDFWQKDGRYFCKQSDEIKT